MDEGPKAPKGRIGLVMTDHCERCQANLIVLCERALGSGQSVAGEFPCPKCGARLRRKLPAPLVDVRRDGLTEPRRKDES